MKLKVAFITLVIALASQTPVKGLDNSDLIKNADPGKMSDVEEIITLNAETNLIGARGAVQI